MTILRGEVRCECGYIHDLAEHPCPTVWNAFRDTEEGDLRVALAKDLAQDYLPESSPQKHDLQAAEKMLELITLIFECPECGRLIWNRGDKHSDLVFSLEKERPEAKNEEAGADES